MGAWRRLSLAIEALRIEGIEGIVCHIAESRVVQAMETWGDLEWSRSVRWNAPNMVHQLAARTLPSEACPVNQRKTVLPNSNVPVGHPKGLPAMPWFGACDASHLVW